MVLSEPVVASANEQPTAKARPTGCSVSWKKAVQMAAPGSWWLVVLTLDAFWAEQTNPGEGGQSVKSDRNEADGRGDE